MSPFWWSLYTALLSINLSHTQDKTTCSTLKCDNPPNLYISCNATECELDCTTANACNGILYSCGNIENINSNETTKCIINCQTANSCNQLTVISMSSETEINCESTDSCIDANFVCNPSSAINLNETSTTCNLECNAGACSNVDYLCTGYLEQCNANCDESDSCNNLNMLCDQYISTTDHDMTCNLQCDDLTSCDAESKFSCTDSSDAQCSCDGECLAVTKSGIDTFDPTPLPTISPAQLPTNEPTTAEPSPRSHIFSIIDVEIYAIFSILFLILFILSLILCWRLQITLDFFRVQFFDILST